MHLGAALYDDDGVAGPAVGDWVALRGELAVAVLPRRSAFVRTAAGRTSAAQVVAANLDVVLVVDALVGEARLRRVERYLAVAWSSGATPVVVLTKADLCDDVAAGGRAGRRGRRWASRCWRSARSPARGSTAVRALLRPGPHRRRWSARPASASPAWPTRWPAGRSPRPARSGDDGRGRHTTTARELHLLPGGGLLIDTPGMRELALYDDGDGRGRRLRRRRRELAADCRFRDCAHRTEPGCAVAAAIDDGAARPGPAHRLAQAAGRGAPAAAAGRRPGPGRGEGAAAVASTGSCATSRVRPALRPARDVGSFASVRVLVIGSGAREHALCVALQSDPAVTALACAPGNAGTARSPSRSPSTPPTRPPSPRWPPSGAPTWSSSGPEVPLVAGAADAVRDAGIACFGPSAAGRAARGHQVLRQGRDGRGRRADRPGLAGRRPGRAGDGARRGRCGAAPYVVKDDGLAAGKGVLVTADRAAAVAHGRAVLDAGHAVLIEEFLDGPEVSLFALSPTATTVVPLLPAQDFKRRGRRRRAARTPAAWAPTRRCPGRRPDLVDEVLATVAAADRRRDGPPRRAVRRPALRRAGADLARACGWSSSTPGSATRRPRSCWRCWRRRWPGCCTRPRPARWPSTRRCAGGTAPR